MKRNASGLSGILAIDKPPDMTSHDVVNRVRSATGERRVGHAGTLDPAATGVLLVCVGPATRLSPYLTGHDKRYKARFVFGFETATDDAQGELTVRAPVPQAIGDEASARLAVERLVGTFEQVPPAYSAVKRDGKRAYDLARAGKGVELEARRCTIHSATLDGICEGPAKEGFWWDLSLSVSKGTYIRSIARDLGRRLGSAAHVGALRRVASGDVGEDDCITLGDFERLASQGAPAIESLFLDPVKALGLAVLNVDDKTAIVVSNGGKIPRSRFADSAQGGLVNIVHNDTLLAIYEELDGCLAPKCVIDGGVRRCGA